MNTDKSAILKQLSESEASISVVEDRKKLRKSALLQEQTSMSKEKTELESIITNAQTEMNESGEKLTKLRDKEQELISTSGTSVSTLSEFDKQLNERNDKERTITNDINKFALELDGLKRDLAEMKTQESSLCKILNVFELDPSIVTFDVRPSIETLEKEQN